MKFGQTEPTSVVFMEETNRPSPQETERNARAMPFIVSGRVDAVATSIEWDEPVELPRTKRR